MLAHGCAGSEMTQGSLPELELQGPECRLSDAEGQVEFGLLAVREGTGKGREGQHTVELQLSFSLAVAGR